MKTLDTGENKIQKICAVLKEEALEPAKTESEQILKEARIQAEKIVNDARAESKAILEGAKRDLEKEKMIFDSSLQQGIKLGLESLRQEIEKKFFNQGLEDLLAKQLNDPQLVAKMISAILNAIEKEGLRSELSIVIAKNISKEEVNKALGKEMLDKVKEKSVEIGSFDGGVQVKLVDKKMTLDLTDAALKQLLSNYLRKDFRALVFGASIKDQLSGSL